MYEEEERLTPLMEEAIRLMCRPLPPILTGGIGLPSGTIIPWKVYSPKEKA